MVRVRYDRSSLLGRHHAPGDLHEPLCGGRERKVGSAQQGDVPNCGEGGAFGGMCEGRTGAWPVSNPAPISVGASSIQVRMRETSSTGQEIKEIR